MIGDTLESPHHTTMPEGTGAFMRPLVTTMAGERTEATPFAVDHTSPTLK